MTRPQALVAGDGSVLLALVLGDRDFPLAAVRALRVLHPWRAEGQIPTCVGEVQGSSQFTVVLPLSSVAENSVSHCLKVVIARFSPSTSGSRNSYHNAFSAKGIWAVGQHLMAEAPRATPF